MQKFQYIILFCLLCHINSIAQISFSNGNHLIEISGSSSTYYNQRILKETSDNFNKNRFKLRDAQLQIEGRIGDIWEYELQVDFADIAANNLNEVIDPENPGLMDAYVVYKGLEWFDIKVGYGKVPYSRSSLVPFGFTAYWQRAELVRGSVFNRRDVGVTLSKSFWKQRASIHAGIYTGLGEMSLNGDNDASGNPEFIGRAELAYPTRFRHRDIDDRHTPIPTFAVGINGRYANKPLPEGRAFPAGSEGEYGLKVIDGKKYGYGFDFAFQYMGFSGQFEMHQIKGEPQRNSDPLFLGLPANQTEGYFLAGGYVAQLNYFFKDIKTVVSARYESLDLNDLAPGNSQRFSPAIAYQIKGFDAMVKFQYFNILKEESIDPIRWTEQFRIGLQLRFK